jgi:Mn2+/Fe2+ NRAMP family transporter
MQGLLIPLGFVLAVVVADRINRSIRGLTGDLAGLTVGALIGFPLGIVVFLLALQNLSAPSSGPIIVGTVFGLIIGAMVGPCWGFFADRRKMGDNSLPPLIRLFSRIFSAIVFLLGILGFLFVFVGSFINDR